MLECNCPAHYFVSTALTPQGNTILRIWRCNCSLCTHCSSWGEEARGWGRGCLGHCDTLSLPTSLLHWDQGVGDFSLWVLKNTWPRAQGHKQEDFS